MDVPVLSLLGLFIGTLLIFGLVVAILARMWVGHRRGLGYCLVAVFVLAWGVHLFTGWQEFVSEQISHGQAASVWGPEGYIWTWWARSFENIMSEFLQLAVFVVLTAVLIFEGSAESKDGDERLEAKVDVILSRLDDLEQQQRSS